MKNEFIKVNKSIFYYKQYIREVEWLRYNVKRKVLHLLDKEFVVVKNFEEDYDKLKISFYNTRLDIIIHIECFKKSNEIFV